MTAVQIDVHHYTHTCPAEPDQPHPYDTRRTIVAIAPGGPCRQPAFIRSGDAFMAVPCARRVPRAQQCPACRIITIEHAVTFTFMGHHGPQQSITSGTAA
jgi:hypothetical protein